jgi:hypothetical protein
MEMVELKPAYGQKSFNGKANVVYNGDGTKTLFSYNTKIATLYPDGAIVKHWIGWTATTGRHITAFCGMNKKEWSGI